LGTARWAGDAFVMQDWQWRDHFGPLYGWRRPDGRRRHRRSSVWLPKKNTKTETAALQSLYHALGDGEPNPHTAIAAVDRFQASICFDACARIVRRSPAVATRVELLDSRKRIIIPATDGRIEARSADAEAKEGLNLSFLMLDELHAWKDPVFLHALMYAGAAREEPLVQTISTAGICLDGSIRWEQFKYADGVRKGEIDDDTWHVAIFAADLEDDWPDPATWRKANPAMGVTVTKEELVEQCRIAQQSPPLESAFKRYRLNVWVSSTTQAVDMLQWRKNDAHPISEADFEGAPRVCGGLDLGGTSDLSSYVQLKPCSADPGAIDLLVHCWLPQGALERSRNAHVYQQWAREGHLALMPGAVQDYDLITTQILSDAERWKVESIGMDRLFQGLAIANALNGAGMKVFPVAQTFAGLGPLWREFERLLLAGKVHHGGHPILRWAIQQLELTTDSAGNRKPTRENPNVKIDPVMATLFALDRHARMITEQPPQRSVYEDHGILAI
jgi:phage terminase large subunit-like protein